MKCPYAEQDFVGPFLALQRLLQSGQGIYRDVAREFTTPDDDLCFVLTQHDV